MKNKNAFTLIEIMITISIVGILMVVLLTKTGVIFQGASNTGVKINMGKAESIIRMMITDYAKNVDADKLPASTSYSAFSTDQDLDNFYNDIITKLTSENLKNPNTQSLEVKDFDQITGTAIAVSVKKYADMTYADAEYINKTTTGGITINNGGSILVAVYFDTQKLCSKIYGFASTGEAMTPSNPTSSAIEITAPVPTSE